jgi:hypothetical protein
MGWSSAASTYSTLVRPRSLSEAVTAVCHSSSCSTLVSAATRAANQSVERPEPNSAPRSVGRNSLVSSWMAVGVSQGASGFARSKSSWRVRL